MDERVQQRVMVPPDRDMRVSHMDFNQLYGHAFSFGSKIDSLWQRVVYVHIGMVAAVIFLARSSEPYYVARAVVLGFYTFNVFITYWNLRDAYGGLRMVIEDLKRFPECEEGGSLDAWIRQRRYDNNSKVRAIVLFLIWSLIAYLLVTPVLNVPIADETMQLNQTLQQATPRGE